MYSDVILRRQSSRFLAIMRDSIPKVQACLDNRRSAHIDIWFAMVHIVVTKERGRADKSQAKPVK
jgi:hypothetical protein